MKTHADHSFSQDSIQVRLSFANQCALVSLQHDDLGQFWGAVPLAVFEIYTAMEQRVDRVIPRVAAVNPVEDGAHVTLVAHDYAVTVGIELTVRGGRLNIRLCHERADEQDAGMYRLFTVRLLPGLMRVGATGQVLLPLSSGAIFSPAGKPPASDRFLIYGEQSRWELLPTLPVAAVGEHDAVLVALATSCAHEAEVFVSTDGQDSGGIDMGSSYRQHWTDPVEYCDRTFAFLLRRVETDLLHDTADLLRRHVTDELGKPTLRQRADESPNVAYMLSAYTMKVFFGVTNQGAGMAKAHDADFGKYRLITTCDEAVDGLRRLKQAGIERAWTQSVGWIPNGHDGYYPTHHAVDERIGGEAAFRRMLDVGAQLGYHMHVHDNYNEAYRASPDFNPDHVAVDLYGELTQRGRWGGGQAYLQWMLTLPEERIEDAMAKVKALGVTGMAYVDAIANPLYRNYAASGGGPRGDHARGIIRVLNAATALHGGVGIECGFLYGMLHADSTCMPTSHHRRRRLRSDWPIAGLIDRYVPLYNLALSGLIAMDAGSGVEWSNLMGVALMALHPRAEWGCHAGFPAATPLTESYIARLCAFNDLCLRQLGRLQTQRLVRWHRAGESLEHTLFEDGTEIKADFESQQLWIDGREVARPLCMRDDAPVASLQPAAGNRSS